MSQAEDLGKEAMAQRMPAEAAEAEAEAARLLEMALAVLARAESYFASAAVAHALDLLNTERTSSPGNDTDLPDRTDRFAPSWGNLVDR
jgi:hypothetical protein